ncbi:MAG: hypothetical protein R3F20_03630 [Planctomycetota bacterium]
MNRPSRSVTWRCGFGLLLALLISSSHAPILAADQDHEATPRYIDKDEALQRLRTSVPLSEGEIAALAELIGRNHVGASPEEWEELLRRLPRQGAMAHRLQEEVDEVWGSGALEQLVRALDAIGAWHRDTDARLRALVRSSRSADVTRGAIELLGRHGPARDEEVLANLTPFLKVRSSGTRIAALRALASRGTASTPAGRAIWCCYVETLPEFETCIRRPAEETDHTGVRHAAVDALTRLTSIPDDLIRSMLEVRNHGEFEADFERRQLLGAICHVAQHDERVHEAWLKAASSTDEMERIAAMEAALPRLGDARVIEVVTDRLARDESRWVRHRSFDALRHAGLPISRYRTALEAAIAQPRRWALDGYLDHLRVADPGSEEIVRALLPVLSDSGDPWDVRNAALVLATVDVDSLTLPSPRALGEDATADERFLALIRLAREPERLSEFREMIRDPRFTRSGTESLLVLRLMATDPRVEDLPAVALHLDAIPGHVAGVPRVESRVEPIRDFAIAWWRVITVAAAAVVKPLGPEADDLRHRLDDLDRKWRPIFDPCPFAAAKTPDPVSCRIESDRSTRIEATTWRDRVQRHASRARPAEGQGWRLIIEDPSATERGDRIELVFDRLERRGMTVTAEWGEFDVLAVSRRRRIPVTAGTIRLTDPSGTEPLIRGRFEIEAGEKKARGTFVFPNPFASLEGEAPIPR